MTTCERSSDPFPNPTLGWVLERLRSYYGEPLASVPQAPIDELIATILSQHTSDINTERAFRSLKAAFPDWDAVIAAPDELVADAIRSGGLANLKAPRIRHALADVRERARGFDLSFLATMPLEQARNWLESIDGVGPKTASCVLLFSLGRPALPVDTHVHRVALRLGLVPPGTTAERAQSLLESAIDSESVYAAHMLLIQHGRETCVARRPRCAQCVLVQCCPTARQNGTIEQGNNDRQTH